MDAARDGPRSVLLGSAAASFEVAYRLFGRAPRVLVVWRYGVVKLSGSAW